MSGESLPAGTVTPASQGPADWHLGLTVDTAVVDDGEMAVAGDQTHFKFFFKLSSKLPLINTLSLTYLQPSLLHAIRSIAVPPATLP